MTLLHPFSHSQRQKSRLDDRAACWLQKGHRAAFSSQPAASRIPGEDVSAESLSRLNQGTTQPNSRMYKWMVTGVRYFWRLLKILVLKAHLTRERPHLSCHIHKSEGEKKKKVANYATNAKPVPHDKQAQSVKIHMKDLTYTYRASEV